MKAWLSQVTGGPETLSLGDLPSPVAGLGEALIDVAACAINYPDALIIEDRYQYRPQRPFAPGCEIAGRVLSVGADVTHVQPGDRIMAMCGWGGLAQQAVVPAAACIAMPDTMQYDEGSAFMMTYGTAYHGLVQRAGISAGETLLVLGAAGGVGLAAVQLGKALGARVIAAASSQEKIDVALAQGADQGVIYGAEESELRALSQRFKETADGGFDVVVDPVGGALAEAAVRALNWSGRFLIVGFPAGIPRLPLNLLLLKGAAATGVFYGSFAEKEPAANAANNDALLKLYAKGAIRPVISDRYVFNEAPQAIMDLAARQAHGKLVVMIGQDR